MSKYPFAHCSQNLDMEMEFSVAKITISAHPNFVHFLGLLYISEKNCTFHFLPQTGIGPLQETNGCHLTIWKIQLPDLPLHFPMPEIFFLQMSELLSNKSMTEGSHFLYKPISRTIFPISFEPRLLPISCWQALSNLLISQTVQNENLLVFPIHKVMKQHICVI